MYKSLMLLSFDMKMGQSAARMIQKILRINITPCSDKESESEHLLKCDYKSKAVASPTTCICISLQNVGIWVGGVCTEILQRYYRLENSIGTMNFIKLW